jgi:DNA-binding response OmpR family regulator
MSGGRLQATDFRTWHERRRAMVDTKILLVDDDQDTCASMSDIFLDIGYTVDMAYDGPGALELSGRHQYRLALLDYTMPGMDGLELCRRLKNSQPSVVVALITAFSSIAATGAAAEAGVRCSLLKPVDFAVLMPLVEEVVKGRVDNTPVEIGSAVA